MQPGVGGVGHLNDVRREYGQRDRGPAHEQEATDALEQEDRAAISPRSYRRAERDARGSLPPTLSRLPPYKR
jgi:hypothetical protein